MKRMFKMVAVTAAAFTLFTGEAYAHYCTNASKKDGAGNAGVLFVDVSKDFEVVPPLSTVKLNNKGQIKGGFMDFHLDTNGDGTADHVLEDVYAHTGLPQKALLAAGCGQAVETNMPFFEENCPPSE